MGPAAHSTTKPCPARLLVY